MTEDNNLQLRARSSDLSASVDLKQRNREVRERLDRLDEKRRALEEILDYLASEEKDLLGRQARARQERDRMSAEAELLAARVVEMEVDIGKLERELVILSHRCAENVARGRELNGKTASMEEDIEAARKEIATVSAELEMGRDMLSRLNQKLSCGRHAR
ncbi:MAG: hypothetical protein JXR96_16115 [Deltaproteobacteria bacterium]|nr:hypothetical protein [Deltaproteobacteria bacterium]